MEFVEPLLRWLHFVALGVGGAATFGLPVIARMIAVTPPDMRTPLGTSALRLALMGRAALGVLIVTGVAMAVLRGGGFGFWFWIKMLLVLGLVVSVAKAMPTARRAQAGDRAAMTLAARLRWLNLMLYLSIVLAAVVAFG